MQYENTNLLNELRQLPVRVGPRPKTTGPTPHMQVEQYGEMVQHYTVLLSEYGGLNAFFLKGAHSTGWNEKFLIDNEFAHIHNHASGSLHLVLPKTAGEIVENKLWGEQHPLAKEARIPATNYMIYGPRNDEELERIKLLLKTSYLFASGRIE